MLEIHNIIKKILCLVVSTLLITISSEFLLRFFDSHLTKIPHPYRYVHEPHKKIIFHLSNVYMPNINEDATFSTDAFGFRVTKKINYFQKSPSVK